MSVRVVIAGAGGFGRGVCGWLRSSPRHSAARDVAEIVFIDDERPRSALSAEFVGTIRDYRPKSTDEVVCAIARPNLRRAITQHLTERGARFHSFVDDRATVAAGAEIAEGVVICPGSVISANAVIREHVHINFNCSIGHDTVLGAFSTLSPAVNVMGEVSIGEGVFLGGSAVVLPRTSINADVTVGAGAVVVSGVNEPGVTVVGNPAKDVT